MNHDSISTDSNFWEPRKNWHRGNLGCSKKIDAQETVSEAVGASIPVVSRDLIGYLNDAKRSLASEAENSQLLSGKKRRTIDSLLHTQNQHPVKMAAIMNISASARVAPKVRVCPLENPRRIGRDPGGRRLRGLLHSITPGFLGSIRNGRVLGRRVGAYSPSPSMPPERNRPVQTRVESTRGSSRVVWRFRSEHDLADGRATTHSALTRLPFFPHRDRHRCSSALPPPRRSRPSPRSSPRLPSASTPPR